MNKHIEIYLAETQSKLFVEAYKQNYEIVDFIKKFMKSALVREIDQSYSRFHSMSSIDWLDYLLMEYNNLKPLNKPNNINLHAIEWLGFFYRRWHFITGDQSKDIVRFLNPSKGIKSYYTSHQLNESESIELFKREYNLRRNAHRKYESKIITKVNYYNQKKIYYPFLAKRVLIKLLKDKELEKLKFSYDNEYYDLINENKTIGLYSETIFNGDNTIKKTFEEAEQKISYFKVNPQKSIFFCFIFKKEYELKIDNIEIIIEKELETVIRSRFDYIYFYILGKLIEINNTKTVMTYFIPISTANKNKAIKEMNEI